VLLSLETKSPTGEHRAAVVVLGVGLFKLNSRSCKKAASFPMTLKKQKSHKYRWTCHLGLLYHYLDSSVLVAPHRF
jgi:Flp pilus assembly protein protease CpaA